MALIKWGYMAVRQLNEQRVKLVCTGPKFLFRFSLSHSHLYYCCYSCRSAPLFLLPLRDLDRGGVRSVYRDVWNKEKAPPKTRLSVGGVVAFPIRYRRQPIRDGPRVCAAHSSMWPVKTASRNSLAYFSLSLAPFTDSGLSPSPSFSFALMNKTFGFKRRLSLSETVHSYDGNYKN